MSAAPAAGLGQATLAVWRHELRVHFYSPLTYVFLCGFALAVSVCVFLIGDLYASDEASIRPLLVFVPWIALVLVPALAMRAWADTPGDRAMELLCSLPLGLGPIVAGKFLAGYVLLLVALALTVPVAVTVFYLGEPDAGVVLGGYLGMALLLAFFYAAALFAASFAREAVASFVAGFLLLAALLLLGWDVFGRLLEDRVPAVVVRQLGAYSPRAWLDVLGSGLLGLDAALYHLLAVSALLAGAAANLRGRALGWSGARRMAHGAMVLFALALALALSRPATAWASFELDITEQREHTLHDGTGDILERLPQGTRVTLYWSASQASVPVAIKSHARRVERLLERMAAVAGQRLEVVSVDPEPDTDAELEANARGMRRVPMTSGEHFYLGATFQHDERTGAIPYFDLRRDRQLEYDIAVALAGLGRERIARVGVLSPLVPPTAASNPVGLSFISELKRGYDVAVIPFFSDGLPSGLDVLIVLDAPVLKREMLYAIDQFVMRGGRLVVMLDAFVRINAASNQVRVQPSQTVDDISDLLLRYGVRFEGDTVVGDAALASPVSGPDGGAMSFPYWLRIPAAQLSSQHPVTASLNEILLVEPGALALGGDAAQGLVVTSARSGSVSRARLAQAAPRDLALEFAPDGETRVLAAVIEGPFASAFAGEVLPGAGGEHRDVSDAGALVFAVADVDWLFDPFAVQLVEVGDQAVARPLNDNLAFLLNMVEYASGDPALLGVRSRGRLDRPFTRVQRLFVQAETRYRQQEAELARRIAEAEGAFARRVEAAGVDGIEQLPPELREEARRLAAELLPARRELRHIRQLIREEVQRLGRAIALTNLASAPLLVLALFALIRLWRGRVD